MNEYEWNRPHANEEDDESVSTGWSARWDSQALGEVRSKEKPSEPPASSGQTPAS